MKVIFNKSPATLRSGVAVAILSALLWQAPSAADAQDGPAIELAPEPSGSEAGAQDAAREADESDPMTRGLQAARFARASSTAVGGYGELHLNVEWPEGGGHSSELDLHRLVLFFAHNFDERFRFYGEVEVEHALVAGGGAPGEVGVEQAFVDWRVLDDTLGLRAGIVLVPMGIVNQWHEPPIFNGVERPNVDRNVIPSTWREGGIGIFGQPAEGLRYELYLTGGLDPRGFSAGSGIRGGRQKVAEALASSPAVSGRVEYEPILGTVAGISGFFNMAGKNADIGLDVPVLGLSADARLRHSGFETRAQVAFFHIGDAEALRALTDGDGEPLGISVGSDILGVYGELGYDVLHPAGSTHSLVPFARVEYWDTTLAESDDAVDRPSVLELVFGLTYRPIPQVSLKSDVILRRPSEGDDETRWNLGVGWMF